SDKDGKPRLTRTATLSVAAGQAIPDSYATPDDPRYAVGLRFPTSLAVERRPDGTYYHFRRTYLHRDDARYTWVRRTLDELPEYKALKAKDPAKLSNDERAKLIDAFKTIEIDKQLPFVDGGSAATPGQPQDVALAIRTAVVRFGDASPSRTILDLLSQPESADRDASIDALAKSFLAGARKAAEKAVLDSPLSP